MIHIWPGKCIYYLTPFVLGKTRDNSPVFQLRTDFGFLLHGKNNKTLSQAEEAAPEALHLTGLSAD